MGKIDFAGLKLKLLSSIVAISAIQVLKAFMNLKNMLGPGIGYWLVGIHLLFVVSGPDHGDDGPMFPADSHAKPGDSGH